MAVGTDQVEDRMEAFMATCRRSGIKATHQRREIFREVAGSDEHPDAETIFARVRERVPTISRDTVYRTLSLLEETGLLSRLELFSGRARFDANTSSHHHFVCTECGLVRDFASREMDQLALPRMVGSWGKVRSIHVQARGTCNECLAAHEGDTQEE